MTTPTHASEKSTIRELLRLRFHLSLPVEFLIQPNLHLRNSEGKQVATDFDLAVIDPWKRRCGPEHAKVATSQKTAPSCYATWAVRRKPNGSKHVREQFGLTKIKNG
jgi:hypothetical protein